MISYFHKEQKRRTYTNALASASANILSLRKKSQSGKGNGQQGEGKNMRRENVLGRMKRRKNVMHGGAKSEISRRKIVFEIMLVNQA